MGNRYRPFSVTDGLYVTTRILMNRPACWLILYVALLFLYAHILAAATSSTPSRTGPLSIEDVLKIRSFASLMPIAVSRDGRWLAYAVQESQRLSSVDVEMFARTGVAPWSVGTHICVTDVATGTTRTLGAASNSWLPAWSPDGKLMAFLSDRDTDRQTRLWVWDRVSGGVRRLSSLDIRGNQIEWTSDGRYLFVTTVPLGLSTEDFVARVLGKTPFSARSHSTFSQPAVLVYSNRDKGQGPQVPDQEGPWSLDLNLRDLVRIDVTNGAFKTIVHGKRVAAFSLSPDDREIGYTIPTRFESPSSQQVLFDVAVINLPSDHEQRVASDLGLNHDGDNFSWSADSSKLGVCANELGEQGFECLEISTERAGEKRILFRSSLSTGLRPPDPVWNANGDFYFVSNGLLWQISSAHKTARKFTILDREVKELVPARSGSLWLDTAGTTVVVVHDPKGEQDGLYRINLTSGGAIKLIETGQCYTCTNVFHHVIASEDGRSVFYFAEDAEHDETIWVSDIDFRKRHPLTDLNPQFGQHELGCAQLVHWLSDDGQPLRGALLLPPDYTKGTRYPLIVWIYGGALQSQNLDRFGLAYSGPLNMQLLASRGYAVFLPDAPQQLGSPMFDLAKTVLPGINKVIELGIADPDRLAIAGHSYGGYCVLSLLVQTTRFRAAIMLGGTGSLLSAYGQLGEDGTALGVSIQETGQGLMGTTPWNVRDRYIENSPMFYLDRIGTPLLIAAGMHDTTTPPYLTDEVFVGLRRLNKEVEYVKYRGEGHSPISWQYEDQTDLCSRMLGWLDAHLRR